MGKAAHPYMGTKGKFIRGKQRRNQQDLTLQGSQNESKHNNNYYPLHLHGIYSVLGTI